MGSSLFLFRWQSIDKGFAQIQPIAQVFIIFKAFRGYINKASQWPAGKVHFRYVFLFQAGFIIFRSDPGHEGVIYDAATHVICNHEAEPAEHFFDINIKSVFEMIVQSFCKSFVVCHCSFSCHLVFLFWVAERREHKTNFGLLPEDSNLHYAQTLQSMPAY